MRDDDLPKEDLDVKLVRLRARVAELEQALLRAQARTEAVLRESTQTIHQMIVASPVAMVMSRESDGRTLDANDHLGRIMGLSSQQLIGRSELDFYADPSVRRQVLERLHREGHLTDVELRLKRLDGTGVWILLSVRRMTLVGNRPCTHPNIFKSLTP